MTDRSILQGEGEDVSVVLFFVQILNCFCISMHKNYGQLLFFISLVQNVSSHCFTVSGNILYLKILN